MFDHLDALNRRLSAETAALAVATKRQEIALRTVWIAQIKKEIADERDFLCLTEFSDLTADELLAELAA